LQTQELKALEQYPAGAAKIKFGDCRPGYEARAGTAYSKYFDDPWFDGNNYEATILATPGRGTAISAPSSAAADLGDDAVAAIVQEELELAFFPGDLQLWNLSSAASAEHDRRSR